MNFWHVMAGLHVVTPYAVVLLTALVTIGFARLLLVARGVVRLLTLGFLLLYFMVMARTMYWDLLPRWISEEAWAAWIEATHGTVINVVFHVLVVVASWYSLRAIHRSIPEAERGMYLPLTAILYPWNVQIPGRKRPKPPR